MSVAPLPIAIESSGPAAGVATITLEQPGRPVVVLDHELLQRLDAALDQLPAGTKGVVIASASERVFIAGADLKTISDWTDEELDRYLAFGAKVFCRLATLPCPTAAAINGAALGGGLELAMHCEALIAAPSITGKPYPVGLPEASLGLCPGWGGTNLLPARLSDPGLAITRTCTGLPFHFDNAAEAGLFTKVVAPDELLAAARLHVATARRSGDGTAEIWRRVPGQAAKTVTALDAIRTELPRTDSAAAVVEAVDIGLTRGYAAALDSERRSLVRLRHTPLAREKLADFFAKSKK